MSANASTGKLRETGQIVETMIPRRLDRLPWSRWHWLNSQIIAAIRASRGYRSYRIEVITSDPDEVRQAIEAVGLRARVGEARFLRPPYVIEVRELGEDTWLVRGRADVAPTMEWLAEDFLRTALRSRLSDETLLAEPIIYTLDEGTLSRYERRVLIR